MVRRALSTEVDEAATVQSARARRNRERGYLYENTALQALRHIRIHAELCGGAGDRGVDLRGHWYLPAGGTRVAETRLPIVGQCKRLSRVLGPMAVRELAGVAMRDRALGLLISASGFSQQAMREWRGSKAPLVLVDLPADALEFSALTWNDAAAEQLRGLVVGRRALPKNGQLTTVLYYYGVPVVETSTS
ncbi:hypothetical protein THASP1DRAFT_31029 [Thamnocephalis sphaerospora]|uniref:Restriction endonuclease type IV Mrr domain-containing protein n=1 Tax=Thamnocephalis sphaerospora TaxID=78915 RepID=A0A4P9XMJ7_9FUNG|nr:hypothetical protein THASP1DRAFT_31029 [Thamnocephalis sphaerospora]|eukprot:RKP07157.1 hypothetical protein THASP1DRAFT_31029 [Thamnocephalis sphaerospora]